MDKNDARFKLAHVVMPRAWYAKVKEIRRAYRRKRPGKRTAPGGVEGAGKGDGDGPLDCSEYATDRSTSFESFDQAYPTLRPRPIYNLKGCPPALDSPHRAVGAKSPGDESALALEKSLIDAAFPLSPKNFRLAPSALQFSLSPAATSYSMSPSSPSSRFCPSPCRYPAPCSPRIALSKGADIPYPASPRRTPLHHPASVSAASAASTLRLPPGQGPGPLLHRSRSEARPVRASLLACFSDDFRLAATKSDSDLSSPSPPRHSQYSLAEAQGPKDVASRKSVTGTGSGSGSGNSPPRPSAHRRSLSFSCMSNAGAAGDSPDTHHGRIPHLPLLHHVVSPPPSHELKSNAWEQGSALQELHNQVVRKEVSMRKRSPVDACFRPSNADDDHLDEDAMLVQDHVKESTDVDNCCGFRLSTSSGGGDGIAEPSAVLWEKGFSSATTSEDPETSFFTSIEADSACVTPRSSRPVPAPVPVPLPATFTAFPSERGQAKCARTEEPWEASFIPEERELSCPSSDSETDSDIDMPAVEFSEAISAWDTDDSTADRSSGEESPSPISSPASSCRMELAVMVEQMDKADSQDAEDYSTHDSLELEERGLRIRTRQPLQRDGRGFPEGQASPCDSSVSSTGAVCEEVRARELEQQIMSVSPRIRMWEPLSVATTDGCTTEDEEDMEVSPAYGWEESLLAMRKCSFSSDDDYFVLNDLEARQGRHVVSPDQSPDRLEVHHLKANKARTGKREGSLDRRRSSANRHTKAGVQARPRLGYSAMKEKQTRRGVKESHMTTTTRHQGPRPSPLSTAAQMPPDILGKVRESVPVVTRSYDPYGDFRDSMLEMIVEKEILDTPDLEELLQAYLALNSEEYHGLIVEVFTDLWYEIFESEESGY